MRFERYSTTSIGIIRDVRLTTKTFQGYNLSVIYQSQGQMKIVFLMFIINESRHERSIICIRGKSSCVKVNVLQYPSLYFHIYVFTELSSPVYDGYWIRDRKSMGLRFCHSPLMDHLLCKTT